MPLFLRASKGGSPASELADVVGVDVDGLIGVEDLLDGGALNDPEHGGKVQPAIRCRQFVVSSDDCSQDRGYQDCILELGMECAKSNSCSEKVKQEVGSLWKRTSVVTSQSTGSVEGNTREG
ncbi:hypothetical protein PG993_005121 [Apiospora rasikravindrae]|uniref:Uncharacterized protein n=1 Tax=Apiospora rasikravindrae TaxID=990691 RepID=A0ABR1TFB6_9PEZI